MDDGTKTTTQPSRWLRVILVASLAMNLLVVGLVVGSALSGRDGPRRGTDFGLGPVARALEGTDRRAIGLAVRRDMQRHREYQREVVHTVIAALRSEPFDPQALQGIMDAQRAQLVGLQENVQIRLLERISMMSPDQRAAFADRIEADAIRRASGR